LAIAAQTVKAQRVAGDQVIVAREALNGRVEAVRAGTNLLNQSDNVAATVLAKKAALDAANLDTDLQLRALSVSGALQQSLAALRAAQAHAETTAGASDSAASFARLADEHEARAAAYGKVLDLLRQPVGAPEMSAPEWEALRFVQLGRSCQKATTVAAESTKVAAEHVSRGVAVTTRRARQACC